MKKPIVFLLISTLLLGACASTTPPQNNVEPPANVKEWLARQSRAKKKAIGFAVAGAALGAISGVAIGASSDQIIERAIGGAIVGAAAGYAFGKHQDAVFAGRDHAIRQAAYDRSQGYVARIEEVAFDPPHPKPGTTATLYVRYLVLGPDPNEAIKVTMFRGLKYDGNYVFGAGPNEFVVPQGGGVIESKVPVTFPKQAEQGTYSIEALLEDPQKRFPQAVGTGALHIVARAERRGELVTAAP